MDKKRKIKSEKSNWYITAINILVIAPQISEIFGVTSRDKIIELMEIGIKNRLSIIEGKKLIFNKERLNPTKIRMTKKVRIKYLIWL